MSARSQVTLRAQEGGVEDEVTEDHVGSPERLCNFVSKDSIDCCSLWELEVKRSCEAACGWWSRLT